MRALFFAVQIAAIVALDLADPVALLVVLGVLFGYAASEAAGRRGIAAVFLAMFVAYWILEKYALPLGLAAVAPELARVLTIASVSGVSYIGFKLVHFFVDVRAGAITRAAPLDVAAWLLYAPTIIAGPIQRFQDWQAQRAAPRRPSLDAIASGLQRIASGLFLKVVLANTVRGWTLASMSEGALALAPWRTLVAGAVWYTLYLYWDFAGYSSMAIGLSRLLGVELPENFRRPLLARNLATFWNCWHISLSELLRDYLFYPIGVLLRRRNLVDRKGVLAAALPPFVTFVIAGVWHGAGLNYVLFGALHGAGLGFLAAWRRGRPSDAPLARWWRTSRVAHALAVLATFAYVTFAFVFFANTTPRLAVLGRRLLG